MKQKRIAIIVDNPKRDLPSCVLVALELARRGFKVFLLPMNRMNLSLFGLKPEYILLNYLRQNNDKLVRQLLKFGSKIGVLDTEGGVFTKLEDTGKLNFFNVLTSDAKIRRQVTDYFVWGEDLFWAIKEENSFSSDQVKLTGTPRIDFYHTRFSRYFASTRNRNQKVILLNSAFPVINPKFSSVETELRTLVTKFNYRPDFIRKLVEALELAQDKMIALTRVLATHFSDQKIIFRPHPFEALDLYKNAFSGLNNVEVTNEKTVDEWLYNSGALVHYECSTAIEASLFRVPALSFAHMTSVRPIPYADMVTHFLETDKQFVETLQSILSGTYTYPAGLQDKIEQVQRNLFGFDDGLSYLRIAEQVEKSISKQTQLSKSREFYFRVYYQAVKVAKRALGKTSFAKEKTFYASEVQEIIGKLIASVFPNSTFEAHEMPRGVVEIALGDLE